jgi:uncharacterized membrane protein
MFSQTIQALSDSALGAAIREGDAYFPWIESFHVLAVVIVFGTIAIVDMRLVGLTTYRARFASLVADLLRYTWIAFAGAVLTGTLMFISNATVYAGNTYFQFKMALILLAGVNMAVFHLTAFRKLAAEDGKTPSFMPPAARLAGWISLGAWIAVIGLGRTVGFTLGAF